MIKKFIIASIGLVLATVAFSRTVKVNADSIDVQTSSTDVQNKETDDIENLDKYVEVKNNNFVLSKNVKLSEDTTAKLQKILSETNAQIEKQNLVIDPYTKTIEENIVHF